MRPLDPTALDLQGSAVIEASAGTGKTYTITSLVLRLIVEARLTIDQILVVTYTRAATAELRDRIKLRIDGALRAARGEHAGDPFVSELLRKASARDDVPALAALLERALYEIDDAPVLTIHGFCQRVLSEHAFESDSAFDVRLSAHAGPMLEQIADDYYVRELYEADALTVKALSRDEPAKLRSLAGRTAHHPSLRVIPDSDVSSTFDEQAWQDAFAQCRALWSSDKARIVELVSGLPRQIGKNVVGWAEIWESVFARPSYGFVSTRGFEAGLRNFTSSGVAQRAALKQGFRAPLHPFFAAAELLREAEERYAAAGAATALDFRRRFLRRASHELSARTEIDRVRTFDALLRDLDEALEGPRAEALLVALRKRYRAALVDEFQDTDPTQYRIFARIFAPSTLFMIGDPKQAIYGFRGADVCAYMAARDEAGERVYTLDVNRRSDEPLIAALNGLYAAAERPFALAGIEYRPVSAPTSGPPPFRARGVGAPLELCVVDGATSGDALRKDIARRVASEIVTLLEHGHERFDAKHPSGPRYRTLSPADVAVLCRMNREALWVQEALSERGVPSVFQGDESVFESDDAIEIERVLRALAHPGDLRALRSLLGSFYVGYDAEHLFRLAEDDDAWDAHRANVQRLNELWLTQGFTQALRAFALAYDVERTLLARPDGTRRITNLWHLGELLAEAAIEQRLGPLGLLRFLALVRDDEALRAELVGDAHELRLESNEDAVRLTTVHKSKGLEYPVVFCPFAWEGKHLKGDDTKFVRFHDPRADLALTLDLGSEALKEHQALAEHEALAEALRLLYVALTRAQHRVVVVVPTGKSHATSALAYTLFGGGDPKSIADQIERLDPPSMVRALAERFLALASSDRGRLIEARMLGEASPSRFGHGGSGRLLEARTVRRKLDVRRRTSSFSALTHGTRGSRSQAGIDRDDVESNERSAAAPPSSLVLDPFPRGARAGELVHAVLERADFAGAGDALAGVCRDVIAEYRYPLELSELLSRGLARVLETPLDERGLLLRDVPQAARLNELEFLLPVSGRITSRDLAAVFREHATRAVPQSYARELRSLTFDALTGFLRGFVDLVFMHEGRFFVVDYKSNRLGPSHSDYVRAELTTAMTEHHYILQYHLYTLAVHRYLEQRTPGYAYERHFGGVYYLFVRGMDPLHPPGTGVFFDRPSEAFVGALDRALEGGRT